jgi:hypothetical protein
MIKYSWRDGAHFSSKLAQPFGEWLATQPSKAPEKVLEAIKRDGQRCPVYDEVYGLPNESVIYRYRLARVSGLLNALYESTNEAMTRQRTAMPVRKNGTKRGDAARYEWQTTDEIRKDADKVATVLNDAVSDLKSFARRYDAYRKQFEARVPAIKRVFVAITQLEKSYAKHNRKAN